MRESQIVSAIKSITDQLATGEEEQRSRHKKRAFWEKVTTGLVFFTFVATVVTAFIFNKQLEAMHAAERPYLGIDTKTEGGAGFPPAMAEAGLYAPRSRLFWTFSIHNYGKSTATVQWQKRIRLDRGFECSADGCDWSPPTQIVPTQAVNATIVSKRMYTRAQFTPFFWKSNRMVGFVRLKYLDSYGNEYPAVICLERNVGGRVGDCTSKYDLK